MCRGIALPWNRRRDETSASAILSAEKAVKRIRDDLPELLATK